MVASSSFETALSVVAAFLASLGGATVVLFALSAFLGRIWADRIAKQTMHRFSMEIEGLKSESQLALEQVRAINQVSMQERQVFSQMSQASYQEFFETRFKTYRDLLATRNSYLEASENFVIDEYDGWGDEWVRHYKKLRKIASENQIFLSAKLDESFQASVRNVARFPRPTTSVWRIFQVINVFPRKNLASTMS